MTLIVGDGLGPHGLGGGNVAVGPQPGMGIFAMMATIGTVPVPLPGPHNASGQCVWKTIKRKHIGNLLLSFFVQSLAIRIL